MNVPATSGDESLVLGVENALGVAVTTDLEGVEIIEGNVEVGVDCCEVNMVATSASVFLPGEKKFVSLLLIDGLLPVTSHAVVVNVVLIVFVIEAVEAIDELAVESEEDDIFKQYFFSRGKFFIQVEVTLSHI